MATAEVTKKARAHKEYAHLVKPLSVQKGPPGLYPEPLVWMEGKDTEGFGSHFWYEFIQAPRTCHPVEGTIVHPYDECLIFAGNDVGDIRHLGAEISITLGEEREEHTFMDPSVVLIPKGTPHGPVTVRKVERPIVHYGFGLAPDYKASILPTQAATAGSRHGHLIKRLLTDVSRAGDQSGMGYTRMVDEYGVMHPIRGGMGPAMRTSWYGSMAITWREWTSTSRGAFTADAANGIGEARCTLIPRKKSTCLSVSMRTISIIWARKSK